MICEQLRNLEGVGAQNVSRALRRDAARHIEECPACCRHVLGLLAARGVTEDDLAARVRAQIAAAVEADEPIVVRIAE